MSQHQRRRTQLSFARQIVRAESMQALNLLRQIYRLELGRQSPDREVLDLLAQTVEGHLRVKEMAEPPTPAGTPAPTENG